MIYYAEVSMCSPRGCLDPPLYPRIDAAGMARRLRATPLSCDAGRRLATAQSAGSNW